MQQMQTTNCCVVCLEQKKTVRLCERCGGRVLECPLCRQAITERILKLLGEYAKADRRYAKFLSKCFEQRTDDGPAALIASFIAGEHAEDKRDMEDQGHGRRPGAV